MKCYYVTKRDSHLEAPHNPWPEIYYHSTGLKHRGCEKMGPRLSSIIHCRAMHAKAQSQLKYGTRKSRTCTAGCQNVYDDSGKQISPRINWIAKLSMTIVLWDAALFISKALGWKLRLNDFSSVNKQTCLWTKCRFYVNARWLEIVKQSRTP